MKVILWLFSKTSHVSKTWALEHSLLLMLILRGMFTAPLKWWATVLPWIQQCFWDKLLRFQRVSSKGLRSTERNEQARNNQQDSLTRRRRPPTFIVWLTADEPLPSSCQGHHREPLKLWVTLQTSSLLKVWSQSVETGRSLAMPPKSQFCS